MDVLHGSYDPRLVSLSIAVAVVVSYTALNLAGRVTEASGRNRRQWLIAGAATMGLGIWSMHFIGMLAYRMEGMTVAYDVPLTIVSIVPALLASLLALSLASGPRLTAGRLATGGLLMGGGIVTMHYTGMAAMVMPAAVRYDPALLALSVVIAILGSLGALWLVFRLREEVFRGFSAVQAGSALAMGFAISGMHYTGMAAARFEPLAEAAAGGGSALSSGSIALAITGMTLLVLTLVLTASFFDRRIALQGVLHTQELEVAKRELERQVAERTAELRTANERLRQDIIARERAEAALFREKERAQVTLHSIGDAVITADADGAVQYLNPVAERLTGWRQAEAAGRALGEVFEALLEDTRQPAADPLVHCCDAAGVGGEPPKLLRRRDGSELPIEDSAAPIRDRDGRIGGVVVVFRDVSEARSLARQLSFQATHDPLTGLVNRSEFERRVAEGLAAARSDGASHVVCFLDLDQFKIVNDTCGHVAGDELLRQLVHVLRPTVRESDTLARLGGDEFGVLLRNCPLAKAREIAEELRYAVKEFRFSWQEKAFSLGVSIGLAPLTAASGSVADVLSAADVACYAAKDAGRNRIHSYQPDDEELARRHGEMHWISRINHALEEDRFQLCVQPIVSLDGNPQDRHYEVLVRMLDGEGKSIPPGAFIPAAERYDLMPAIDRWVIRNAFAHHAGNGAGERLAINLSGGSMSDEGLLDFVRGEIARWGVEPAHICFEITETAAVANLTRAVALIQALRGLGCRFALDDFGAGLSSFAYLKNMPVDYLKIDGGFVRDMVDDPMDRVIVEAIHRTGELLGIRTIAEFVENQAIVDALKEIGVHYAQGYHFGRPEPLVAAPAARRGVGTARS